MNANIDSRGGGVPGTDGIADDRASDPELDHLTDRFISQAAELDERLGHLHAAVRNVEEASARELNEIQHIAHRLAGNAAIFGFPTVSAVAAHAELAADAVIAGGGDIAVLRRWLIELRRTLASLPRPVRPTGTP